MPIDKKSLWGLLFRPKAWAPPHPHSALGAPQGLPGVATFKLLRLDKMSPLPVLASIMAFGQESPQLP